MKKILMGEMLEYKSEYTVGSHHYANLFSKNGYKVLWLSPIFNFLYILKNKEVYHKRKKNSGRKIHKIAPNIFSYSPSSLLMYGNYRGLNTKLINYLSIYLTFPSLRNVLSKNRFLDVDILWITNVKYRPLIDIVNYKKLVYRCSDDISGFQNCCESMIELEKEIIQKADFVFATANNLIEKKSDQRSDIIYLPNGVEISNFEKNSYLYPVEYEGDKNKKCLYIGAIEDWFDIDLMYRICNEFINITFYLIGPVKVDLSKIENLENIRILGKRQYNKLPDYLYYCDLTIIPFKINELTNSITPIKLYEYMSLGKEVVSTAFKEMKNINSPAYLSETEEEFIKNIKIALENNDKNKEKIIEFSKNNTWNARYNLIQDLIDRE